LQAILNSLRETKYRCCKRIGKTKFRDESNFIAEFSQNGNCSRCKQASGEKFFKLNLPKREQILFAYKKQMGAGNV